MSAPFSVMLYVCISGAAAGTPNFHCERTPHPSYASCFKALAQVRIVEPPAGRANAVVAYCGTTETEVPWDDGTMRPWKRKAP
jgi:hypothetical protein